MSIVAGLNKLVAGLVHPVARGSAFENARHAWFIVSKLGLSFSAAMLGAASLASAFGVNFQVILCFALALVPGVAAVYVIRTGKLLVAQAASFSVMLALPNILSFTGVLAPAAIIVWLAVLPVEVLLTSEKRLMESIVGLSVTSIILAVGRGFFAVDHLDVDASALVQAQTMIAGMLYLAAVALCGTRLGVLRDDMTRELTVNFEALAHTAGDLIVKFDRAGSIMFASQLSERLFGVPSSVLMGRGFFERVHVADRPSFLKNLNDAARLTTVSCFRLRFRGGIPSDSVRLIDEPVFHWIEVRASAQSDPLDGLFAVIRDIGKLVQHEQDLEQARTTAEHANALKDRFLANVSHELRTPLNAIIGFSEMLASADMQPKDPAKIVEYACIIRSSGEHLLSVVNTILDMSKMEAGNFSIDPEHFDIAPLVDLCCDMVRLKAEQENIKLTRDIAPNLGELIADKRACKQVLINLLSNAVKFTPAGGEVAIQVRPEGNSLRINISDTGIGIAPVDLARLGNPFFQAKSTYDRAYEGTGLGLSVVRGLVGLHGGSIGVESAPGQGTRVSVRLPLDCRGAAPAQSGSAKIETIVRYAPIPAPPALETPSEPARRRA